MNINAMMIENRAKFLLKVYNWLPVPDKEIGKTVDEVAKQFDIPFKDAQDALSHMISMKVIEYDISMDKSKKRLYTQTPGKRRLTGKH